VNRTTKLIAYAWAAPATTIGLLLGLLAVRGGRAAVEGGVLEIHGPLLRWVLTRLTLVRGGVAAITFGHVVLGRDGETLTWSRDHERVHVAQYERWGPFFLPAYVVASLWALASGGDFYRDNYFERAARAEAGDS
jgi:hypothetical protein